MFDIVLALHVTQALCFCQESVVAMFGIEELGMSKASPFSSPLSLSFPLNFERGKEGTKGRGDLLLHLFCPFRFACSIFLWDKSKALDCVGGNERARIQKVVPGGRMLGSIEGGLFGMGMNVESLSYQ